MMIGGTTSISIPPLSTVMVTSTCNIPAQAPQVNLIAVWPHMHKLGTEFKIQRTPLGGTQSTILDWAWNFGNQPMYTVSNGLTAKGGDIIDTTCTWYNTSSTNTVHFGELSSDEMCLDFFYYYPAPVDQQTTCGVTL